MIFYSMSFELMNIAAKRHKRRKELLAAKGCRSAPVHVRSVGSADSNCLTERARLVATRKSQDAKPAASHDFDLVVDDPDVDLAEADLKST